MKKKLRREINLFCLVEKNNKTMETIVCLNLLLCSVWIELDHGLDILKKIRALEQQIYKITNTKNNIFIILFRLVIKLEYNIKPTQTIY